MRSGSDGDRWVPTYQPGGGANDHGVSSETKSDAVAVGDRGASEVHAPIIKTTKIAFSGGGEILVVDVATGEFSHVADGGIADWLDDDTLVVSPAG